MAIEINRELPDLRDLREVLYRGELMGRNASTTYIPKTLHVCLLDDDPVFGRIMGQVATRYDVRLSVCESFDDLPALDEGSIDVFILDYDLGAVTGVEVSEYLEHFIGNVPMVLVSISDREPEGQEWPAAIKEFIVKDMGPGKIIKTALDLVE